MNRISGAVRRRKWLLITPLLIVFVIPALWSALTMRTYQADSLVWLDSNASIASVLKVQGAEINTEDGPIQAEADALGQLLQSRSFVAGVVKSTPLRARADTPKELALTVSYIQDNTKVEVVGPNALKISFAGQTPGEAVAVVKAITSGLVDWTQTAARRQSEQTVAVFAEQVDADASKFTKAQSRLREYERDHPETKDLVVENKVLKPSSADVDPAVQAEYLKRTLAVDNAKGLYESSVSELGATRVLATLQRERYINGLHTVDEPVAPTSFMLGPLLLFDFLALVAAILIAAAAIAIAEASDNSVRSGQDLRDLDLPLLASVRYGESADAT